MNKRLKALFIANGWPQTCEIRLSGCLKTFAMSFAHSKKSRFIQTDDDWMEAALACCYCHEKIEAMPHAEMEMIVKQAIENRDS